MSYAPDIAIMPLPPMVSTMSRYCVGDMLRTYGFGVAASSIWPTAKKVIYVPFSLDQNTTVLKVWWANGATVGTNNVDCGVYSSAAGLPVTKLVSSGSTLSAGASVVQVVDVTDTPLAGPALYFLALTLDGTTATIYRSTAGVGYVKTMGIVEETTGSFGLPTTATPVALATATVPLFGFSTVTTI